MNYQLPETIFVLMVFQAAIVVGMLFGLGWGARIVFAARDLSLHARDSVAQVSAMHETMMGVVPDIQGKLAEHGDKLAEHGRRLDALENTESTEEIPL
jgi:hypothetical protein